MAPPVGLDEDGEEMKELISDAAIKETAAAVVAEYGPEFVYNPDKTSRCFYSPVKAIRENPAVFKAEPNLPKFHTGCLVGVILDRLGVNGHSDSGLGVYGLIQKNILDKAFSKWAQEYLSVLQDTQDQGGTWGEALAAGDKVSKSNFKTSDQYSGV